MTIAVCIPARNYPSFPALEAAKEACLHYGDAKVFSAQQAHNVCVTRNKGVAMFLKTDCSHLLFVDNDVIMPPDAIEKLVAVGANVVTGCVPSITNGQIFIMAATGYNKENREITWGTFWFDGVSEVPVCGCGCILIRREVFETLPFPWFRWPEYYTDEKHYYTSEDVTFCEDVIEGGLGPIMAHGDVRCGHLREVDLSDYVIPMSNAFGSHLKTLHKLGAGVESVMEFGGGMFSTPAFLDRSVFPDLKILTTIETETSWAKKLPHDDRLTVSVWDLDKMVSVASKMDVPDLVFIDCATEYYKGRPTFKTRCDLIRHYMNTTATVVVHDADEPLIMEAIKSATYDSVVFNGPNPLTAVLFNAAKDADHSFSPQRSRQLQPA